MDFYAAMLQHHHQASEIEGKDEEAVAEREGHMNLAMFYSSMALAEGVGLLARHFAREFYEDDEEEDEAERISYPLYGIDEEEVKGIIEELLSGTPAQIMASEVLARALETLADMPE